MLIGGITSGGGQGICPSVVKEICPPHMHTLQLERINAGCPCTNTWGLPGIQGEVMAGMHGIGVNTPIAAEVAAATVGLDRVLHMPKGMMFTMGAKSMIFPLGTLLSISVRPGLAINDEGAMPKVHVMIAPVTTYESPIIICYILFSNLLSIILERMPVIASLSFSSCALIIAGASATNTRN